MSTNFKVVTQNVMHLPLMPQENVIHDVNQAAAAAAGGVVLWQEIEDDRYLDAVRALPDVWNHFHAIGDTPISWDSSVWQRLDTGAEILHEAEPRICGPKRITWALLKHRATGAVVVFNNVHYVAGAWNEEVKYRKDYRKVMWREGNARHKAMITKWIKQGYAIVGGGDFNQKNERELVLGKEIEGKPIQYTTPANSIDIVWLIDGTQTNLSYVSERSVRPTFSDHDGRNTTLSLGTQNSSKTQFKVAETVLPAGPAKDDIKWVTENFDPDIWGAHVTLKQLPAMKEVNGYGVAQPKSTKQQAMMLPILYKRNKLRLVGTGYLETASGGITMAHFILRQGGDSVWFFNTLMDKDTPRKHLTTFAAQVTGAAKGNALAFWGGEFTNPLLSKKLLNDEGLDPAGDFAKVMVGAHNNDTRVKEKTQRSTVMNGQTYVLGVFTFNTSQAQIPDPTVPGTPTGTVGSDVPQVDAGGAPIDGTVDAPVAVARQPFQKDNGSQTDHTNCCGGEYA